MAIFKIDPNPGETTAFNLQWHRIDSKSVGLKVHGQIDLRVAEKDDEIANYFIHKLARL